MKTIEQRSSKRVHFGLAPDFYDKIGVLYPDALTEVYVYQIMNEDGTYNIVGYVEVVYTDASKVAISSVTRLAT
jgi:hypothetical protein